MAKKILRRRPLAFGYKQRHAGCHLGTGPSREKLTLNQCYFGLRGPDDGGSDNQIPSNRYKPLSQKQVGSSAQLGLSKGRAVFVCLKSITCTLVQNGLFLAATGYVAPSPRPYNKGKNIVYQIIMYLKSQFELNHMCVCVCCWNQLHVP